MVWFEVRALIGAFIGIAGFAAGSTVPFAVHANGTPFGYAVLLGMLWLIFWLVYFPLQDGRQARSPAIVCNVLMICGAAMAVEPEVAKLLADRRIAHNAFDQWSLVVGAVVLAVLVSLVVRNLVRRGSPLRSEHIVGYDR